MKYIYFLWKNDFYEKLIKDWLSSRHVGTANQMKMRKNTRQMKKHENLMKNKKCKYLQMTKTHF